MTRYANPRQNIVRPTLSRKPRLPGARRQSLPLIEYFICLVSRLTRFRNCTQRGRLMDSLQFASRSRISIMRVATCDTGLRAMRRGRTILATLLAHILPT
jgi:hypothetical protein